MTLKHYNVPTDRAALVAQMKRFGRLFDMLGPVGEDPTDYNSETAFCLAYVGNGRTPDVIFEDYDRNRESFIERCREVPELFKLSAEALRAERPFNVPGAEAQLNEVNARLAVWLMRADNRAWIEKMMERSRKSIAEDKVRRSKIDELLKLDPETATKDQIIEMVRLALGVEDDSILRLLTKDMPKERIAKAFLKANAEADRIIQSGNAKEELAKSVERIVKTITGEDKPKEDRIVKIDLPPTIKVGALDGTAREVVPKPGESMKDALARTLAEDLGLDADSPAIQSVVRNIVKSAPEGTFDKRVLN